jgi:hypothetical protein
MADRELALDLEPDDDEEDRQEPVVDPVEQRSASARFPSGSQARFPPGRDRGSDGRVAERQREDRGEPQEQPDDGPQRTKSNAADWMRCPSEPSMASASELSSQVPA